MEKLKDEIKDRQVPYINAIGGFVLIVVLAGFAVYLSLVHQRYILAGILAVIAFILLDSTTVIQPNNAKVLTFMGSYLGTIKQSGWWITVPFTSKDTVSLRVSNFNSDILKVNDHQGNPIEIAAVVVYKVVKPAQALFGIDNYEDFVRIQSESAIRHVAGEYAYDTLGDDSNQITLRSNGKEVSDRLTTELQERLQIAGVEVVETRITHLSYATEIASAMLQKQQSAAILAARKMIVDGAVSITEDAINRLGDDIDLNLTDEQWVKLINNIMVSIISEKGSQPVINTGED